MSKSSTAFGQHLAVAEQAIALIPDPGLLSGELWLAGNRCSDTQLLPQKERLCSVGERTGCRVNLPIHSKSLLTWDREMATGLSWATVVGISANDSRWA